MLLTWGVWPLKSSQFSESIWRETAGLMSTSPGFRVWAIKCEQEQGDFPALPPYITHCSHGALLRFGDGWHWSPPEKEPSLLSLLTDSSSCKLAPLTVNSWHNRGRLQTGGTKDSFKHKRVKIMDTGNNDAFKVRTKLIRGHSRSNRLKYIQVLYREVRVNNYVSWLKSMQWVIFVIKYSYSFEKWNKM